MQNANMIMSIFMFYYQKKGIPSENPFLFRKELYGSIAQITVLRCTLIIGLYSGLGLVFMFRNIDTTDQ